MIVCDFEQCDYNCWGVCSRRNAHIDANGMCRHLYFCGHPRPGAKEQISNVYKDIPKITEVEWTELEEADAEESVSEEDVPEVEAP